MKVEELRIGNLISVDGSFVVVTGIIRGGVYFGEHGYIANIIDWLKPIPLTEEWLLKFRFKFWDKTGMFNYHIHFRIGFVIFDGEWWLCIDGNRLTIIKYVHQLQNLYFALTGEELKCEP